jgi:putative flippase GtrA
MPGSISKLPTVGGRPASESPVVPIPVKSPKPSLAHEYLMVFVRYAGIGVIGTLVHFLILVWLVNYMTPVAASTVGAVGGAVTNFLLARIYVFTTRPGRLLVFRKFMTVAVISIALNAAIMFMLTPVLPLLVCQVVSSGTVLVAGFLLNSVWSFSDVRK